MLSAENIKTLPAATYFAVFHLVSDGGLVKATLHAALRGRR